MVNNGVNINAQKNTGIIWSSQLKQTNLFNSFK
jgi:hypothetical protein